MSKMTILVCLYNKNIATSNTLKSLLKAVNQINNQSIFIWDNSVNSLDEKDIALLKNNFENFTYKHTPENVVLSKIYNSLIVSQTVANSYLMLCDDDSEIPESFFIQLEEAIEKKPLINLFLPQIYSNSILVSPAKDYLIKTSLIKELDSGILKADYITAINSGMVISNRVFIDGFRYDERLNFYGTDNFFMYEYAKKNKDLFVLDIKINHDLSFNGKENTANKIRIFKEIKRANRIIYSKNVFKKTLVAVNNSIVSIKLCLRFKTLAFLYD
jgi:GT2 family glycosyltransferase